MDVTPDSEPTRQKLEMLPLVREQWRVPAQRQWAQRIWRILTTKNPNLVQVIDTATIRSTQDIERELGIAAEDTTIQMTREEWRQATLAIGHSAGAAATYATAEALSEIQSLESTLKYDPSD